MINYEKPKTKVPVPYGRPLQNKLKPLQTGDMNKIE